MGQLQRNTNSNTNKYTNTNVYSCIGWNKGKMVIRTNGSTTEICEYKYIWKYECRYKCFILYEDMQSKDGNKNKWVGQWEKQMQIKIQIHTKIRIQIQMFRLYEHKQRKDGNMNKWASHWERKMHLRRPSIHPASMCKYAIDKK